MDKIRQLQDMINESNRIVFFGGAGVSTESNIPDFRSADGLYKQKYRYSPEQIVSHSFFMQHTEEFYDFYKEKMMFLDAKPNKAHLKLAELEAAGKLTAVITQNIDGLHQAAGSKNVLELHGSIHRNYCMRCKKQYSARFVKESKGIPTCDCGGTIRPDVVLYEEGLDNQIIQKSIRAISEADMLIIGGTSLVVYPAAGFIDYFHGKYLVLINKDATARDVGATLTIHEPIGEVLDRIHVQCLCQNRDLFFIQRLNNSFYHLLMKIRMMMICLLPFFRQLDIDDPPVFFAPVADCILFIDQTVHRSCQ